MGLKEIQALAAARTGVKSSVKLPNKPDLKAETRTLRESAVSRSSVKLPKTNKKVKLPRQKKRIKPRNKKMQKTMRQLNKAYPVFLTGRPDCAIRSPVCTGQAKVVNHNRGRGANLHNQEDWTPCCTACNDYIEKHHAWAEERGFKASRHKKDGE